MKTICLTLFCVVSLFWATKAQATIILTMDDLPFQPVNGLVHPSGVSFAFTVGGNPNLDANYNSFGPGVTTFISDPSIEGTTAGVLQVFFPASYNSVSFGLAASAIAPTSVNVELFDALNVSLGITPLLLSPMPTFAENQFVYTGANLSRLRLDLTPSLNAGRFAFDNLRLDNVSTIPEPTSFTIFSLVSLGGWVLASRRRREV
jgi:hypothetical protein